VIVRGLKIVAVAVVFGAFVFPASILRFRKQLD
jgi:hypothetical protein